MKTQTIALAWGLPIPPQIQSTVAVCMGARALYNDRRIELLPDRLSWHVSGFSEDDADPTSVEYENRLVAMRPLRTWFQSKGLPQLRSLATSLSPDEDRTVEYTEGNFHVEANPRASYGYLYIAAWQLAG
jgi:hypothetical protein